MLLGESRILFIVIYYYSESEILECINSIRNSKLNSTIYIHLNSELSQELNFLRNQKDINIVEFSFNLGFGNAVNSGFQYALDNNYDYVLLINPDITFSQNDLISRMIQISKKYNNECILSPLHFKDKSFSELDDSFKKYLNAEKIIDNNLSFLPFVNAAFWMLPIYVIRLVGGFDPFFFLYGEDNNYAYRLIEHKIPIIVIKDLEVVHSRKSKLFDNERLYYKSKYFLCQEIISSNEKNTGVIFSLVIKRVLIEFYTHPKSFKSLLIYWKIFIEVIASMEKLRTRKLLYFNGAFLNLNK